jgi:uncharacterized protein YxeA
MKTIDITIPLVILAILALLFIGQTEINGKFPLIHIERPLCIFGAILIALGVSCFYYQGKSDAEEEYLEELDSLKKDCDELLKKYEETFKDKQP